MNLSQVKSIIEMESHEERIQEIIAKVKLKYGPRSYSSQLTGPYDIEQRTRSKGGAQETGKTVRDAEKGSPEARPRIHARQLQLKQLYGRPFLSRPRTHRPNIHRHVFLQVSVCFVRVSNATLNFIQTPADRRHPLPRRLPRPAVCSSAASPNRLIYLRL